jgi:hypothetical protein
MGGRVSAGVAAGLILACATTLLAQAPGDSLVSIGDLEYLSTFTPDGKIKYLKFPVLGCPLIVKAGDSGRAMVKLADGGITNDWEIKATSTGDPVAETFVLPPLTQTYDASLGLYTLKFQVPADVPDDTYDVSVASTSSAISDGQPNCLRVVPSETGTFTFVVLADTQYGDPRGWFDDDANRTPYAYNPSTIVEQIKKEVRALKPTFAILAGDLCFGWNYTREYEGAWKTWMDAGFPVFFGLGNHDGQVSLKKRTFLGVTSPKRNGFDFWRKTMGPLYYSMKFGGTKFLAINSFDGPPERRDGFLIAVPNWGGQLSPLQKDWIASQLEGQTNVIPFMHHNPNGPYSPNNTFENIQTVLMVSLQTYMQTGEFAYGSQEWNDAETGEWLRNALVGKSPITFVGHKHRDYKDMYGGVSYAGTTCCASDTRALPNTPGMAWGYRPVQVLNGAIEQWEYALTEGMNSFPAGNMLVEWLTPNDGKNKVQKAQLTSGVSIPMEMVLECYIKSDPMGYTITNGTLQSQRALANNVTKLWVKATTPISADYKNPFSVTVEIKGKTPTPFTPAGCGSLGTRMDQPFDRTANLSFALLWVVGMAILLGVRRTVQRG